MSLIDALEAVKTINNDLFAVDLDGTEVIFRLPSFRQASQYAQILGFAEDNYSLQSLVYEHIFQNFVVDEYMAVHDTEIKAGIPETIAKTILYMSGADQDFKDYTNSLMEVYRSQTESIISIVKRSICSVFGGYKMSDLEDLNFQQLIQIYIQAEKVMLDNGIIEEGLKFKEPEVVKPFRVEDVIKQDAKDYRMFDHDEQGPRLTEDPAYKAKMEEFAFRQKMKRGG